MNRFIAGILLVAAIVSILIVFPVAFAVTLVSRVAGGAAEIFDELLEALAEVGDHAADVLGA